MLDIYTYRCIGNIKLDIYIAIIQQKTPSHNKREGNENGTSDIHVRPVRRNGSRKYPTFGPSMGNRSRSGIVPGYFWTELVCVWCVRSIATRGGHGGRRESVPQPHGHPRGTDQTPPQYRVYHPSTTPSLALTTVILLAGPFFNWCTKIPEDHPTRISGKLNQNNRRKLLCGKSKRLIKRYP